MLFAGTFVVACASVMRALRASRRLPVFHFNRHTFERADAAIYATPRDYD